MGLWYSKDSGFELIAYSDADHAGCKDDCKSTSGGLQFLGGKLVSWSSKKQDCTSAIAISCNPVQHSKTKHIDIRYHFIKEHVEKVIIMVQQQHAADVHPDELCPPNKRERSYRDANKKVELGNHMQSTDNNHNSFVPTPSFFEMVPFYKQVLGFTMELKTPSSFPDKTVFAAIRKTGTDNQEKDEKQSQNDKTGLGMEKTVKEKAKSKPESQSSQKVNRKVNWSKSKSTQVNPGVKVKEI
ncbi:retrovirus-related pol polyprotein from transposon TNT 1-94 [Tanacetum coccineum]|uniref:Retrovirus-related pol polyprotein from transposon TNT 1-94 n=1 Tax=Tanacetum coccineum TaxID=301880 RepID=A0ABQ5DVL6_9ASTR